MQKRSSWAKATFVTAVAIGLAAGCSLTTSLDGFTGGAEGPDRLADGSPDGLFDAPASPSDAGADAAPSAFSCKSAPSTVALCEDFDSSELPGAFTAVRTSGGGAVQRSAQGRSAPNAALLTVAASSDPSAASLVRQGLAPVTKEAVVELDVRLESTGTDAFDLVTFANGPLNLGFQIEASGALTWDEDIVAAMSIETPMGASVGQAVWTHVRLRFVIDGNLTNATLSLDGAPVATHAFQSKALVQGPNLLIGDEFIQGTPGWRVQVDNVVVTLE